ncbi:hypothetical protein SJ05684_c10430 [Sinorhizobium sojae CCBAU 05684]|uniref:Resolvase HTH domain-containing protein n=2 Tax=Sinorhizobium sojae TaxID=716925 RepID=A0A249P9A3_9HYPH|nr:hypothetical protein SJ05684_c10430 [Sinorhizobium sojae CCBAU 05684]
MSSVRIGWLFGGLHHSAVLDAFKGEAPRWQGIPADKVEEIKRLRSKGLTYPQIAEAAGVNRTTVQKYLNPGLRERENLRRRERAKR